MEHIYLPWLLITKSIQHLDKDLKLKLDNFLGRIIGNYIIFNNEFDNQEIMLEKYLKVEYQHTYFHSILNNNPKCISGHNGLELQYRKRTHPDWRPICNIVVYCPKCNHFFY